MWGRGLVHALGGAAGYGWTVRSTGSLEGPALDEATHVIRFALMRPPVPIGTGDVFRLGAMDRRDAEDFGQRALAGDGEAAALGCAGAECLSVLRVWTHAWASAWDARHATEAVTVGRI